MAGDPQNMPSQIEAGRLPLDRRKLLITGGFVLLLLIVWAALKFTPAPNVPEPDEKPVTAPLSDFAARLQGQAEALPDLEAPPAPEEEPFVDPLREWRRASLEKRAQELGAPIKNRLGNDTTHRETRDKPHDLGSLDTLLGPQLFQAARLQAGASALVPQGVSTAPETARPDPFVARNEGEGVLPAGSFIRLVLVHRFTTDEGGPLIARVARDVWDQQARRVLIPAGSHFVGTASGQPRLGESRVPARWTTLELPNGSSLALPDFPGATNDGAGGVTGKVEGRWPARIAAAAGLALTTAVVTGSQKDGDRSTLTTRDLIEADLGLNLGRAFTKALDEVIALPKRIVLEPGTQLLAVAHTDLVFPQESTPL